MDQSIVQYFYHIKGIPMELIYMILRYTYRPQQTSLLEDINNYSKSLLEIKDIYYNIWFQIEPGEHLNWLENDIVRYANNYKLTNSGPHFKMNNILNRSVMNLKLKELPIYNNYALNVNVVINIFWGLFTVAERKEFIVRSTITY